MKILVISSGPIPSHESSIVEGGGVRSWTLFRALRDLNIDASIALPAWSGTAEIENILVYGGYSELFDIASKFDGIIINYAFGTIAHDLFKYLPERILRIADLYVPIHIEILARNVSPDNLQEENYSYLRSAKIWEDSLKYADIYLVASKAQKTYYMGIFAALHLITPLNIQFLNILVVPQASLPSNQKVSKRQTKEIRVLWWGGFYPWFDSSQLVAISKLLLEAHSNVKIRVVGGKNPFIKLDVFDRFAEDSLNRLRGLSNVTVLDWVPYSKRFDVFNDVDIVLMMNNISFETELSWRTRILDAVEFNKPILTNGIDPYSESLISYGAAFKISNDAKLITQFLTDSEISRKLESAISKLEEFKKINNHKTALKDLINLFANSFVIETLLENRHKKINNEIEFKNKLFNKILERAKQSFYYAKKYGIRIFVFKVLNLIHRNFSNKWKARFKKSSSVTSNNSFVKKDNMESIQPKGFVLVLHQIDRSGAVLVGIDIFQELKRYYSGESFVVTAKIIDKSLAIELENSGIQIKELSSESNISWLRKNHDVLINSAAVPSYWIYRLISTKSLKTKIGLFIHENNPEQFINMSLAKSIEKFSNQGLNIFCPSLGTASKIGNLYNLNLRTRVEMNKVSASPRKPDHYVPEELDIVLVGPTNDSRKRQIDVLIAVANAQSRSLGNESRKINITFVGVTDDPIGLELRRLCPALLKPGSFRVFGRLKHEEVLKILGNSNVVVSLSDNESFGMYIAEAMSSGAVVVRTKVSGYEETVRDGENGFGIDQKISSLEDVILLLANKNEFPEKLFLNMMERSRQIINPYLSSEYIDLKKFFEIKD